MHDIVFNCPHCGQHIACNPEAVGQETACPTCGQRIAVPAGKAKLRWKYVKFSIVVACICIVALAWFFVAGNSRKVAEPASGTRHAIIFHDIAGKWFGGNDGDIKKREAAFGDDGKGQLRVFIVNSSFDGSIKYDFSFGIDQRNNFLLLTNDYGGKTGVAELVPDGSLRFQLDQQDCVLTRQPIGTKPTAVTPTEVARREERETSEPAKTIEQFSEIIRSDSTNADAYRRRGNAYMAVGNFAQALKDHEKAIEISPDDVRGLNDLGWVLATAPNSIPPNPPIRNGEKALRYARLACQATQFKMANCLDTLAAAYAEAGCFEEAVNWQRKALALETNSLFQKKREERLSLYEQGKPFRQQQITSSEAAPNVVLSLLDEKNQFLLPAISVLVDKGFHVLLDPQILSNSIRLHEKNLVEQKKEWSGEEASWSDQRVRSQNEQTIVFLKSALAQNSLQPNWPHPGQYPRKSAVLVNIGSSVPKEEIIRFDDTYWLSDPWAEMFIGEWADKVSLAERSQLSTASRLEITVKTGKSPVYYPSRMPGDLDYGRPQTYEVPDVSVTTYVGLRILKKAHIDIDFPPSVGADLLGFPQLPLSLQAEGHVVAFLREKIEPTWFHPSDQPAQSRSENATTESEVASFRKTPNGWVGFSGVLGGNRTVYIWNPNDFQFRLGLRSVGRGRDFVVGPHSSESVNVPDGRYDVFFQYSTDPASLYQGDSFSLNNNDIEIQIVAVVDGNYGIRKITRD